MKMNLLFQFALLALAVTSLQAVAEELPGQQARGPEDWLYLAYGRGRFESKSRMDVSVQAKERHELRCCSKTQISGWTKSKGTCDVWHESDRLVGLDGTGTQCFHAVTYTEAQAICKAQGDNTYVCTKSEVESGCAKGSGCGHNADWVWTSDDSPPGPPLPEIETIPEDDYMFLACGSGMKGHCEGGHSLAVAQAKEKHEVRCCSSRLKDAWMVSNNCNNWHESDLIDLNGTPKQCIHAATYAEAQQICDANDAYVCTRDQVLQGCAQGSGCSHDVDMIWTSNRAGLTDILTFQARQSQAASIAGVCTGATAKVWGDPHFVTFDNLKYDCQGQGEFVIAMSKGSDPLAIHGRFVKRRVSHAKPTVTASVAIKVLDNVPVIHVSVPDQKVNGRCPFTFTIGDNEDPIPNNDVVTFFKNNYNGAVNAFSKQGRTIFFTYRDQEARVQITAGGSNRCVLNTNLCLTPENHGGAQNIVGLLGSPTGSKGDDWMNKDGTLAPLPAGCDGPNPSRQCKGKLNKAGHDWCMDNWCIGHPDNSLWTKETHALYNQCDDKTADDFFDNVVVPAQEVVAACQLTENPEECETDTVVELDDGGNLEDFLGALLEDEEEDNLIDRLDAGNAEDVLDGFDGPVPEISDSNDNPIPPLVITLPKDLKDEIDKLDSEDFGSDAPPRSEAGSNGDPHFKTWQGEHFEYHGQCDVVLAKDSKFADGLGMEVQIRTKLVRFWSYIKTASILIGNDVLEIQGSADSNDRETHYWFNFEYQGDVTEIGGFPLSISSRGYLKRSFEIDLSSKYPGQKIVLSTFREFVSVDFKGSTSESFGSSVGILGDYKTGDTLARDGFSVINDFVQLGNEWQVLPADSKLFHEMEEPQFPSRCIVPEDPRGERRRRLDESTISVEAAEAACSKVLSDDLDIKDCVYDILATQDMDMVGAF
eukprot:CAMPEP_0113613836 /NCGR_PEP_ID=MMETSP0017_2-20120614/6849_1 /TAXON_ID=2856 /ORGANISM="Cylindrotheca closterium" /LENGTH=930 /DNA_ID=CAMNT_0000522971 /DNA_START=64 /DNA_END=2856 /DNA_ORIENTATION=- /assembly_acc=CAM_ASM_000147